MMDIIILTLLSILLCSGCSRQSASSNMSEEEPRVIMDDVSERNRAYQPLTERDDSMMQRVVEFYKKHGTSNDLMEAYYLLGSVYRDLHEAPKAIEAFLNGIDAADTLNADCRYDIMARTYGQKCDILRKQGLHNKSLEEEKNVYKYATLANDTALILDSQWARLNNCFLMCDYQTVVDECMDVLEKCKQLGRYTYGAKRLCTPILANIELGRYEDAEKLISIYEQYSEVVDPETYECKFPIYYYAKGRLLTAQGKLDSAEMFFRREMKETDWNNRQSAYRGLHEVFQKEGRIDSAYKYAVLQSAAVDSDYQEKVTANIQNLHELYDYSRAQKDSFHKTLQLEEKQRRLQAMWLVIGIVTIVVLFAFYCLYIRYQKKIVAAVLELERSNARLAEREHTLELLNEQLKHTENEAEKLMLAEQMKLAEEETMKQEHVVIEKQEELNRLRKWAHDKAKEIRMQYQGDVVFQTLMDKVKEERLATEEDYERVKTMLLHDDPRLLRRFYKTIPDASEMDKKVFLLFRIGLKKSDTSVLMGREKTTSAKACDRMFERTVGRKPSNRAESYNWLLDL